MKLHPKVHPLTQKAANIATERTLIAALTKETDSEKSSELDPAEMLEPESDSNALIAKTIAEGGLVANKNSLSFLRTELKKKIVKEVLSEVLPDIGAYDVNGTVEAIGNARKGRFHSLLKFLGFVKLNLHETILTGSFTAVEKYIVEINEGKTPNPMLINQADEHGRIPLIIAAKLKNAKFVRLMLHYKATPDIIEESTGRSALFYSVLNETHEMTEYLLEKNASANLSDFACVSPLMIAALHNDQLHCDMLCKRLAEVDAQDQNGWTPLHYAASSNAVDCIKILFDWGAHRDIVDNNKRKPIHIAKFCKHGFAVSALEDLKARIASVEEEGGDLND